MKKAGIFSRKLSFLFALALLFFAHLAQAQKSGSFYLGDADGNGIIEVPDLSALTGVLGNPGQPDSAVYAGHPQSRFRQELDGNGLLEVPDLSLLLSWLGGDFSSRPGNPDQLEPVGDTDIDLALGDSVSLSAYALSPSASGSKVRTGLGVIFKNNPALARRPQVCETAQIYGYDVAGGVTVNAWRSTSAYHYTLKPDAPDNGLATVRVNTNGCLEGQVIFVEVYIPADSESGVAPGRFPDKLSASSYFTVNVTADCQQVTAIDVRPDDPVMDGGDTLTFSAICTLADSSTVNCTTGYCSTLADWMISGDLSLYAPDPALTVLADLFGTSGAVQAGFDDGVYPPVSDSSDVAIIPATPPDTIITSNPPNPSNNPDPSFEFSCDQPPCIYGCKLDEGATVSCTSPYGYTGVFDGTHIFTVQATNSLLIPDPSPATYHWTIDTVPPSTSIDSTPPAVTWDIEASFSYSCTGGPCTYQCNLDGAGWTTCVTPDTFAWTPTTITGAPVGRVYPVSEWTGSQMIVWGGHDYDWNDLNSGGRYDPAADSWLPTTTVGAPSGRYDLAAVWTGTEMIVWGGFGSSPTYKNDGGKYNPATDSWNPTTTTNAPSARELHSAVWTGTEMIVWGGGYDYLNTGGRYNPNTDSWIATSTTNAPEPRWRHTAVWNGEKMIVWGGGGIPYYNNGGQYNPVSDSWTATSTGTNVPASRWLHTAVWTGTEMIVWGGVGSDYYRNGGRYDPYTDHWTSMASAVSISIGGRIDHTAVWTGKEMIVWGGYPGGYITNDGGKYDPATDSWIATTLQDAPVERTRHTADWTGAQMLVWGGSNYSTYPVGGGRYGLGKGSHTLQVRAVDLAGNFDPAPPSYTWQILEFSKIASGFYHNCGIANNNSLWCWGWGVAGQLGDGTTAMYRGLPTQVGTDTDWADVGAGYAHSCAVKIGGTLWCWGYNWSGQLGTGDTIDYKQPAQVGALSAWTQVVGGEYHSCGLNGGALYCWGRNINGQVGDGTTGERHVPTRIGSDLNWVDLGAGFNHTCAVKAPGAIYCWGLNTSGDLCNSSAGSWATSPVQESLGYTSWSKVAGGYDHTCATTQIGDIYCCGSNSYGQLGAPGGAQSTFSQEGSYAVDWADVDLGQYFSCATKDNGQAWCWGANSMGQLGSNSLTQSNMPMRTGALNGYLKTTAGYQDACAIKTNGTVDCWGSNDFAGLGINLSSAKNIPTMANDETNWAVTGAGDGQNCVVKTNGTLWCSGQNNYGQLGDGTTVKKQHFVQVGSDTNWGQVDGGVMHTCAVKTNGTLYCWGRNNVGQLGDATNINKCAPVQENSASTNWDMVYAGFAHTCARKTNNTVYCWGWNGYGQLGDSTNGNKNVPTLVSGGFTDWTTVNVGTTHSCAVRSGMLYCWGYNFQGQLGLGDSGAGTNRNSPQRVGALSTWNEVAGGSSQTCATNTSNELFCWGGNDNGQLGLGDTVNRSVPNQVGTDTNWAGASGGGYHTCGLKTTGSLYCWGLNNIGQLGDGTIVMRKSPVQVSGTGSYSQMSAGGFFNCAVSALGELKCWGWSNNGQHGDSSSWRQTPFKVIEP